MRRVCTRPQSGPEICSCAPRAKSPGIGGRTWEGELCRRIKVHNLLDEDAPTSRMGRQSRERWDEGRGAESGEQPAWLRRARMPIFFAPTEPDRRLFAWLSRHVGGGDAGIVHCCTSTPHNGRALREPFSLPFQTQRSASAPSSWLVGVDLVLFCSFRYMRGMMRSLFLKGFHSLPTLARPVA
jgi:hypothetical protein